MAYDRRKILLFGVGGVAIAAILILAFLPVRVEVGITSTVELQEIPGYGFQIVKMSEEQASVVHLNLTLDGFDVRRVDGDWIEIGVSGGAVSFNLLRDLETSIVADIGGLDAGRYTGIRFRVVRGLEFTNATLSNGDIVGVDVPNFKVEMTIETFEIGDGMESLLLDLRTGSGRLSNYMLPEIHLTIGTMKIEFVARASYLVPLKFVTISALDAKELIDSNQNIIILDVRTKSEFGEEHIEEAINIPVQELQERIGELEKHSIILVYCKMGTRSAQASEILVDNGYANIYNMDGGITAWKNEHLPIVIIP